MEGFSASAATWQAHVGAPTSLQASFCSAAGNAGRPVSSGTTHMLLPDCTLRLLLQAALCGAGQRACGVLIEGSLPGFQWLRRTP